MIRGGRLVVDEPTDLPEGTELELLPLDPGDWLDEADRAALHKALRESNADVAAGRLVDAKEILRELRSQGDTTMWRHSLSIFGISFLLLNLTLAQQPPPQADEPFLLFSGETTGWLQKHLPDAVARGYRVGAALERIEARYRASPYNEIVLVRRPNPEPVEYLVLGVKRVPTAQEELSRAGAQGFRLRPQTVQIFDEFRAIMEKHPGETSRWEYLFIDTTREKTLLSQTQQAISQGWELRWFDWTRLQKLAIFERPTGAPAATPGGRPPEISDANLRVNFLRPKVTSFGAFHTELNAMARQGYQLLMTSRHGGYQPALLERTADPVPEYQVTTVASPPEFWEPQKDLEARKTLDWLDGQLSNAVPEGFRLRWPVVYYGDYYEMSKDQLLVFSEKAAPTAARCQYRAVTWWYSYHDRNAQERRNEFSKGLSQVLAEGFRIVDAVGWAASRVFFLERCSP